MLVSPRLALPALLALALFACDNKPDAPAAATGPAVASTVSTAAAAAATPAGTVSYAIDSATSKIEWTGAKITGKHDGSFAKFTGAIEVPGGKAEAGMVHLVIDTTSLTADPDKLAGHLKSPDFFDVQKYPTATFDSTSIAATPGGPNGATHAITGNLTLHGQTKSITFPATISTDGGKITAKSEFSIARKDFGLVYPGMPNDLIKDDVSIRLTIDAAKKS